MSVTESVLEYVARMKARHFPRRYDAESLHCDACGWNPFYQFNGEYHCSNCGESRGSDNE